MPLDGPAIVPRQGVLNSGGDHYWPLGVEAVNHIDTPFAANEAVIMGERRRLPDPAVGGQPGTANRLGWTTGFLPRSARSYGLTGRRTVSPANDYTGPAYGPVGLDNRAGRLAAGVRSQETDYIPDGQTIARSFTTGHGAHGVVARILER